MRRSYILKYANPLLWHHYLLIGILDNSYDYDIDILMMSNIQKGSRIYTETFKGNVVRATCLINIKQRIPY